MGLLRHAASPLDLAAGGMVLDVEVSASRLFPRIPGRSLLIHMLIDTGARYCAIQKELQEALALPRHGIVPVQSVHGVVDVPVVSARLRFPTTTLEERDPVQLIVIDLVQQGCQGLIGRDLLTSWRVVYDGAGGIYSIADLGGETKTF
jgi:predicted aspartyl protease